MCGIIGIISQEKKDLVMDAIQSLSDLEYRGYDSSGIAVRTQGGIKIHKCIGVPSEQLHARDVYKKMQTKDHKVSSLIGHNRWATHGKPSISNAHPHLDCEGKIAIVHNGTILNYESLKESLTRLGHTFSSDTDTEVIAHAIEETSKHEKNIEKAFVQAIQMLQGSFAIVVMHVSEPNKLFVAKNGSPLNIGITQDSFIVSSSTSPLSRYTSTFLTLADKEYAVLKAQKDNLTHHVFRFRKDGIKSVRKKPKILDDFEIGDFSRGSYETHMLKEIFEQPSTTQTAMLGRYDIHSGDAILGGVIDFEKYLSEIRHIRMLGCGTAYNAGLLGKEIIEQLTDIHVECDIASEFIYKNNNLSSQNTLITAISQSGETADTLHAIKEAKKGKYTVSGIINSVGSTMTTKTDFGIYTRVGPEIGVASTKAFTGQMTIMYLFALHLARKRNMTALKGKRFLHGLEKIPDLMNVSLTLGDSVKKMVEKFSTIRTIHFLAHGIHLPIAHEAALKFKELTYMEAGSYPMGELKHGPIAVVDKTSLSVFLMPKDNMFSLSLNTVQQILSKGGKVLIITDTSARKTALLKKVDGVLYIPHIENDIFYPLLEIIPLQLFAYYFAKKLKRNVDKPRNLAKSVTVE